MPRSALPCKGQPSFLVENSYLRFSAPRVHHGLRLINNFGKQMLFFKKHPGTLSLTVPQMLMLLIDRMHILPLTNLTSFDDASLPPLGPGR